MTKRRVVPSKGLGRQNEPAVLILTSLASGDKHGHALLKDIESFAGVTLGPGTLYGAITRLEEQNWIRPVKSSDRRRPYTITPAGRGHLQTQLAGLQQVVRTGLSRLKHA